jgi:hypothetical protein
MDTSCACENCGVLKRREVTLYLCGDGEVTVVTRSMTWREPHVANAGHARRERIRAGPEWSTK